MPLNNVLTAWNERQSAKLEGSSTVIDQLVIAFVSGKQGYNADLNTASLARRYITPCHSNCNEHDRNQCMHSFRVDLYRIVEYNGPRSIFAVPSYGRHIM